MCALVSFAIGTVLLFTSTWLPTAQAPEGNLPHSGTSQITMLVTETNSSVTREYLIDKHLLEPGNVMYVFLITPEVQRLVISQAPLEHSVSGEAGQAELLISRVTIVKGSNDKATPPSFFDPLTKVQKLWMFVAGLAMATGGSFLVDTTKYALHHRRNWLTIKSLTLSFVILQTVDAVQTWLVFPWGEVNIIWTWIAGHFGSWAWLYFPLKALYVFAVTHLALRSAVFDEALTMKLLLVLNFLTQIFVISNFFALMILSF